MITLKRAMKWPLLVLHALLYLFFGILLGEDEETEEKRVVNSQGANRLET